MLTLIKMKLVVTEMLCWFSNINLCLLSVIIVQ